MMKEGGLPQALAELEGGQEGSHSSWARRDGGDLRS